MSTTLRGRWLNGFGASSILKPVMPGLQAAQRSKGGRVRSASYESLRADARLMRAKG